MNRSIIAIIFVACVVTSVHAASPFTEFAVPISSGNQTNPATDGSKIVWQDDGAGDWDIYYSPIPPTTSTLATDYTYDQASPAISNGLIVYQDNTEGNWDLYLINTNESGNPDNVLVNDSNDETNPAIWGTQIIWQRSYSTSHSDIELINKDDPYGYLYFVSSWINSVQKEPAVYNNVAVYSGNKSGTYGIYIASGFGPDYTIYENAATNCEKPAIYGTTVVWRDTRNNGDIYGADISNPRAPVVFPICTNSSGQDNPAIYNSTVVWQDNRNGKWDIYGYNLLTKQEYRISYGTADEINPAIYNTVVVYQDNRSGKYRIYGSYLTGNYLASCSGVIAGDMNKDCKVNSTDFALMAAKWLNCNITPAALCQ